MGTRSMIGVEEDGKITAVYCHWDGYLEHNGDILQRHYANRTAIQELLDLGDMSSLDTTVDKCTFYGRDRGEEDTAARTFETRAEMIQAQWDCEYFYLWADDKWIYSQNRGWKDLKEALEQLDAEDAA